MSVLFRAYVAVPESLTVNHSFCGVLGMNACLVVINVVFHHGFVYTGLKGAILGVDLDV